MGQETPAMHFRPVEICPLVWSPNWRFLVPTAVSLRRGVGERMISACVFLTVKHGGGGGKVWGCFAGDTPPGIIPRTSAVSFYRNSAVFAGIVPEFPEAAHAILNTCIQLYPI